MFEKEKIFIRIKKWDEKIAKKHNGSRDQKILYLSKFLSFFGRETLWLALVSFFLLVWYDPFPLTHIGIAYLLGALLIIPIKTITNRKRPYENIKSVKALERKPASQSFPSWHAYNVAAQALIIGVLLQSVLVAGILLIGAVFVAYTRIYLGVHFASDVIFGFLLGIMGFFLTIYIGVPIAYWLIEIIEGFITNPIDYQQFNSMLFDERSIWYLPLVFTVFGAIFLSSMFHLIQGYFEER